MVQEPVEDCHGEGLVTEHPDAQFLRDPRPGLLHVELDPLVGAGEAVLGQQPLVNDGTSDQHLGPQHRVDQGRDLVHLPPATMSRREFADSRDWLTIYYLPPYAPDLNPVEGTWSLLRRGWLSPTSPSIPPPNTSSSASDAAYDTSSTGATS